MRNGSLHAKIYKIRAKNSFFDEIRNAGKTTLRVSYSISLSNSYKIVTKKCDKTIRQYIADIPALNVTLHILFDEAKIMLEYN